MYKIGCSTCNNVDEENDKTINPDRCDDCDDNFGSGWNVSKSCITCIYLIVTKSEKHPKINCTQSEQCLGNYDRWSDANKPQEDFTVPY